MASRWTLSRVVAEGFRGLNQVVTMECGDQATLLLASNGKGKSSVLGAIEWCLFGSLMYQQPENRTNDEIVNMHGSSGEARIRLELIGNEGKLVIERTRAVRKRDTALAVTKPDGDELEGDEAAAYLFRTLGLTFDDFYRAVFLHQESIRGLLTDQPRDRDEALDRLFGLEKFRDIAAAIPVSLVRKAAVEIEGKKQRATDKLSGAASVAEQNRSKYLREALEVGFDESSLSLEIGVATAGPLRDRLDRACREDGQTLASLPQVEEVEDLEKVARKAKETTKTLRLAGAKDSPVDRATSRLVDLQRLSKSFAYARQELQDISENHAVQRTGLGEPDAVEDKKAGLRERLNALKGEREALDGRSKVIGDALSYLRTMPTETQCPVCEQEISSEQVVASLEKRLEGSEREEQERISAETTEASTELDEIADREKAFAKLEEARRKAQEEVSEIELEVRSAITKPYNDTLSALDEEEHTIISQLDALKEAATRREEDLQAIDSEADRLRALHKFLRADTDFGNIRAKAKAEADSEAGSTIDVELEGLLSLEDSLLAISEAVYSVARERASGTVESSRDGVSRYYKRLCNHPYFDGVRIEVEEKSVKGVQKNSYTIRAYSTTDGLDSLASSRLSTGQMNCVALSVYLALRDVLTHNLGFVILDDPSQNLDSEHKEALVDLLTELKPSTQLLIASQDEEFQRLLLSKMEGKGIQAYSLEWEARKGATLLPYGSGK